MDEIKICHIYPDVLNLYGDRGNVVCLKNRLERRGFSVSVFDAPIGIAITPTEFDFFFIGGGQDFEQEVLLRDLTAGKANAIRTAVEEEKVMLAICGGYQLMGEYYKTWDGRQYDFIGALDLYTVGSKKRMIGNFMFETEGINGPTNIVGFENHSGKTYLGKPLSPLGRILCGYGNNGEDKTEGAHYKNVFGTYSHGPILPKNPAFCDLLIQTILERKYGKKQDLEPLEDRLENLANEYMVNRLK